jgi:hypothetical protein
MVMMIIVGWKVICMMMMMMIGVSIQEGKGETYIWKYAKQAPTSQSSNIGFRDNRHSVLDAVLIIFFHLNTTMATTSLHVINYGFELFEHLFLHKRIVWKDGDRNRDGWITTVTNYGFLLVRTSDGEAVLVDLE